MKTLIPPSASQKFSARVMHRTRNNFSHQSLPSQSQSGYTYSESGGGDKKISNYDKIEQLKFEFYETQQEMREMLTGMKQEDMIEFVMKKMESIAQINTQWETMCENLSMQLSKESDRSRSMRKTIKSLKHDQKKQTMLSEKELAKTKRLFERSISGIRNVYERSQRIIDQDINEFELMAQEQRQQRAKFSIKHLNYLRTIEQEMMQDDEFFTSSQLKLPGLRTIQNQTQSFEQTSKYSICVSQRNQVEQQEPRSIVVNHSHNNSYLEKTTPRSSRPQNQQQQIPIKTKVINVVPKLPLPSKVVQQEHKIVDIYKSIDHSQCSKERDSTNEKQKDFSDNKNDESVLPPACMLNDQPGEWDSMLDDTKVNIAQDELNHYQKDFLEKINEISDPGQKILFKQLYAMQYNLNPNLLNSQVKEPAYDCTTPRDLANIKRYGNQNNDPTNTTRKDMQFLDSHLKTSCKKGAPHMYQSRQGKPHQRSRQPNSSAKKYKCTDVKLQEILDITNDVLIMDSPIRNSQDMMRVDHTIQYQDVRMEDIINAPSFSISLRTATDAGGFLGEDNGRSINNSFFRSDNKKSHFKQVKTNNDSYIIYQEEDSMIRDLLKNDYDKPTGSQINKQVFNIIDDNNNNGELSGNNLEESCSSYSKSGNIQFKGTQQTIISSGSLSQLEDLNAELGKLQHCQQQMPESFKSTALISGQPCLENLMLSRKDSQIPTPAFNQRSDKNNDYGQNDYADQSMELNRKRGNYLLQNHNKLIEKINKECDDKENLGVYDQFVNVPCTNTTQKESPTHKQAHSLNYSVQDFNSNPLPQRSGSTNSCKNPNKIKLNFVRKGGKQNIINQSAITMVDKKHVKIPLKQITNLSHINHSSYSTQSSRPVTSNNVSAYL